MNHNEAYTSTHQQVGVVGYEEVLTEVGCWRLSSHGDPTLFPSKSLEKRLRKRRCLARYVSASHANLHITLHCMIARHTESYDFPASPRRLVHGMLNCLANQVLSACTGPPSKHHPRHCYQTVFSQVAAGLTCMHEKGDVLKDLKKPCNAAN